MNHDSGEGLSSFESAIMADDNNPTISDEEIVEKSPDQRFLRFKKQLGSGAFKIVYLGFDTDTGREIAWNIISLANIDMSMRKRVADEVMIARSLSHPRIIKFISAWKSRTSQEAVFITERVFGGSLRQYISRIETPFKLKVIKNWCYQILDGIAHLHGQNPPIIHRDIKCDNIFVNGHIGELVIGDLGLSTTHGNGQSIVGTPEFMAPELYDQSYGPSVDIYAFGMCALEMVTRELPFKECTSHMQIWKKVANGEKPLCFYRLPLNSSIRAFVENCIDPDPNRRPSALQLLTQHPFLDSVRPSGLAKQVSGSSSVQSPSTGHSFDEDNNPVRLEAEEEAQQACREAHAHSLSIATKKAEEEMQSINMEKLKRQLLLQQLDTPQRQSLAGMSLASNISNNGIPSAAAIVNSMHNNMPSHATSVTSVIGGQKHLTGSPLSPSAVKYLNQSTDQQHHAQSAHPGNSVFQFTSSASNYNHSPHNLSPPHQQQQTSQHQSSAIFLPQKFEAEGSLSGSSTSSFVHATRGSLHANPLRSHTIGGVGLNSNANTMSGVFSPHHVQHQQQHSNIMSSINNNNSNVNVVNQTVNPLLQTSQSLIHHYQYSQTDIHNSFMNNNNNPTQQHYMHNPSIAQYQASYNQSAAPISSSSLNENMFLLRQQQQNHSGSILMSSPPSTSTTSDTTNPISFLPNYHFGGTSSSVSLSKIAPPSPNFKINGHMNVNNNMANNRNLNNLAVGGNPSSPPAPLLGSHRLDSALGMIDRAASLGSNGSPLPLAVQQQQHQERLAALQHELQLQLMSQNQQEAQMQYQHYQMQQHKQNLQHEFIPGSSRDSIDLQSLRQQQQQQQQQYYMQQIQQQATNLQFLDQIYPQQSHFPPYQNNSYLQQVNSLTGPILNHRSSSSSSASSTKSPPHASSMNYHSTNSNSMQYPNSNIAYQGLCDDINLMTSAVQNQSLQLQSEQISQPHLQTFSSIQNEQGESFFNIRKLQALHSPLSSFALSEVPTTAIILNKNINTTINSTTNVDTNSHQLQSVHNNNIHEAIISPRDPNGSATQPLFNFNSFPSNAESIVNNNEDPNSTLSLPQHSPGGTTSISTSTALDGESVTQSSSVPLENINSRKTPVSTFDTLKTSSLQQISSSAPLTIIGAGGHNKDTQFSTDNSFDRAENNDRLEHVDDIDDTRTAILEHIILDNLSIHSLDNNGVEMSQQKELEDQSITDMHVQQVETAVHIQNKDNSLILLKQDERHKHNPGKEESGPSNSNTTENINDINNSLVNSSSSVEHFKLNDFAIDKSDNINFGPNNILNNSHNLSRTSDLVYHGVELNDIYTEKIDHIQIAQPFKTEEANKEKHQNIKDEFKQEPEVISIISPPFEIKNTEKFMNIINNQLNGECDSNQMEDFSEVVDATDNHSISIPDSNIVNNMNNQFNYCEENVEEINTMLMTAPESENNQIASNPIIQLTPSRLPGLSPHTSRTQSPFPRGATYTTVHHHIIKNDDENKDVLTIQNYAVDDNVNENGIINIKADDSSRNSISLRSGAGGDASYIHGTSAGTNNAALLLLSPPSAGDDVSSHIPNNTSSNRRRNSASFKSYNIEKNNKVRLDGSTISARSPLPALFHSPALEVADKDGPPNQTDSQEEDTQMMRMSGGRTSMTEAIVDFTPLPPVEFLPDAATVEDDEKAMERQGLSASSHSSHKSIPSNPMYKDFAPPKSLNIINNHMNQLSINSNITNTNNVNASFTPALIFSNLLNNTTIHNRQLSDHYEESQIQRNAHVSCISEGGSSIGGDHVACMHCAPINDATGLLSNTCVYNHVPSLSDPDVANPQVPSHVLDETANFISPVRERTLLESSAMVRLEDSNEDLLSLDEGGKRQGTLSSSMLMTDDNATCAIVSDSNHEDVRAQALNLDDDNDLQHGQATGEKITPYSKDSSISSLPYIRPSSQLNNNTILSPQSMHLFRQTSNSVSSPGKAFADGNEVNEIEPEYQHTHTTVIQKDFPCVSLQDELQQELSAANEEMQMTEPNMILIASEVESKNLLPHQLIGVASIHPLQPAHHHKHQNSNVTVVHQSNVNQTISSVTNVIIDNDSNTSKDHQKNNQNALTTTNKEHFYAEGINIQDQQQQHMQPNTQEGETLSNFQNSPIISSSLPVGLSFQTSVSPSVCPPTILPFSPVSTLNFTIPPSASATTTTTTNMQSILQSHPSFLSSSTSGIDRKILTDFTNTSQSIESPQTIRTISTTIINPPPVVNLSSIDTNCLSSNSSGIINSIINRNGGCMNRIPPPPLITTSSINLPNNLLIHDPPHGSPVFNNNPTLQRDPSPSSSSSAIPSSPSFPSHPPRAASNITEVNNSRHTLTTSATKFNIPLPPLSSPSPQVSASSPLLIAPSSTSLIHMILPQNPPISSPPSSATIPVPSKPLLNLDDDEDTLLTSSPNLKVSATNNQQPNAALASVTRPSLSKTKTASADLLSLTPPLPPRSLPPPLTSSISSLPPPLLYLPETTTSPPPSQPSTSLLPSCKFRSEHHLGDVLMQNPLPSSSQQNACGSGKCFVPRGPTDFLPSELSDLLPPVLEGLKVHIYLSNGTHQTLVFSVKKADANKAEVLWSYAERLVMRVCQSSPSSSSNEENAPVDLLTSTTAVYSAVVTEIASRIQTINSEGSCASALSNLKLKLTSKSTKAYKMLRKHLKASKFDKVAEHGCRSLMKVLEDEGMAAKKKKEKRAQRQQELDDEELQQHSSLMKHHYRSADHIEHKPRHHHHNNSSYINHSSSKQSNNSKHFIQQQSSGNSRSHHQNGSKFHDDVSLYDDNNNEVYDSYSKNNQHMNSHHNHNNIKHNNSSDPYRHDHEYTYNTSYDHDKEMAVGGDDIHTRHHRSFSSSDDSDRKHQEKNYFHPKYLLHRDHRKRPVERRDPLSDEELGVTSSILAKKGNNRNQDEELHNRSASKIHQSTRNRIPVRELGEMDGRSNLNRGSDRMNSKAKVDGISQQHAHAPTGQNVVNSSRVPKEQQVTSHHPPSAFTSGILSSLKRDDTPGVPMTASSFNIKSSSLKELNSNNTERETKLQHQLHLIQDADKKQRQKDRSTPFPSSTSTNNLQFLQMQHQKDNSRKHPAPSGSGVRQDGGDFSTSQGPNSLLNRIERGDNLNINGFNSGHGRDLNREHNRDRERQQYYLIGREKNGGYRDNHHSHNSHSHNNYNNSSMKSKYIISSNDYDDYNPHDDEVNDYESSHGYHQHDQNITNRLTSNKNRDVHHQNYRHDSFQQHPTHHHSRSGNNIHNVRDVQSYSHQSSHGGQYYNSNGRTDRDGFHYHRDDTNSNQVKKSHSNVVSTGSSMNRRNDREIMDDNHHDQVHPHGRREKERERDKDNRGKHSTSGNNRYIDGNVSFDKHTHHQSSSHHRNQQHHPSHSWHSQFGSHPHISSGNGDGEDPESIFDGHPEKEAKENNYHTSRQHHHQSYMQQQHYNDKEDVDAHDIPQPSSAFSVNNSGNSFTQFDSHNNHFQQHHHQSLLHQQQLLIPQPLLQMQRNTSKNATFPPQLVNHHQIESIPHKTDNLPSQPPYHPSTSSLPRAPSGLLLHQPFHPEQQQFASSNFMFQFQQQQQQFTGAQRSDPFNHLPTPATTSAVSVPPTHQHHSFYQPPQHSPSAPPPSIANLSVGISNPPGFSHSSPIPNQQQQLHHVASLNTLAGGDAASTFGGTAGGLNGAMSVYSNAPHNTANITNMGGNNGSGPQFIQLQRLNQPPITLMPPPPQPMDVLLQNQQQHQ